MAELPQSAAEVRNKELGTSRFTGSSNEVDAGVIFATADEKYGFVSEMITKTSGKFSRDRALIRGLINSLRARG